MAKTKRCDEIVARTPIVVLASDSYDRDPTHLQLCGAPVVKNGKCRRHLKRPVVGLDARWRRFLRRQVRAA